MTKLKEQNKKITTLTDRSKELQRMCDNYQEILEKDLGLFNKNQLQDIKPNDLQRSLGQMDSQLKEKQRKTIEQIHEILRSSDLIVNGQKLEFEQILEESDLPHAIRMLIVNMKRQTV